MKTAVSIPDDLFEQAERLAKTLQQSRSQIYSRALRDFVARYAADRVTESLNAVCEDLDDSEDEFRKAANRRIWGRTEW